MSERPFMQLYVSDFLGDTLDLSTEGIGAYMLLLMAMWNAGGSLPCDDAKLARITRLSVRRWRAVATDILKFFERDNGRIMHRRLMKELQKSERKSELRASAGERGGRAKALKEKEPAVANATVLPQHLPDTRSQKEKIEPIAQRLEPAAPRGKPALVDRLAEAAGIRGNLGPGLAFPGEIIALLESYDLEREVLPAIRTKPNPNARKWSYFVPQIHDYVRRVRGIAADAQSVPKAHQFDWRKALEVFRDGTWAAGWGPKPGERGCRVPASLLAEFGFERAA